MVRPASVRAVQRGVEPGDDTWGRLSLGCHDGHMRLGHIDPSGRGSIITPIILPSGRRLPLGFVKAQGMDLESSCGVIRTFAWSSITRQLVISNHTELLTSVKVEYVGGAPYVYHDAFDAGVCNAGCDPQGVIVVWIFTLGFEGDLRIAPCLGSLLDFCVGISFPCRGAITTRGRATYYDVYLLIHGAFQTEMERQLARLPYKSVEVTLTYEVFNPVLQVVALLGVVSVVTVEATVAPVVMPLSPHWIGGFEKLFLPDLEEDLSSSRFEGGVGEPGDGMLGSLYPFP
ncbi:hypothetical protein BHM03_00053421 [Ensete ventricosum]|nr:hypothetical protein BHM03_00053421 [Ensete ventricosum]